MPFVAICNVCHPFTFNRIKEMRKERTFTLVNVTNSSIQYGIMIDINNKDTISCLSALIGFGGLMICARTLLLRHFIYLLDCLFVCLHFHGPKNYPTASANAFQTEFRHLIVAFIDPI